MNSAKKERLEKKGWKVGTVQEFLGLSDQEAAYVELRVRLSRALRERRALRHLSQVTLARLIHSSQSRVAKMEAGDPSVSLDLLIRSLFALGATTRDIAKTIESRAARRTHAAL
jgi:DNA-binding XRE family transcriptional regulator